MWYYNIYFMDTDFIKMMVEKYGVKGLITALSFGIVGGIVKTKWVSNAFSKISDKVIDWFLKNKTKSEEMGIIKESNITNHDIFNYIDFWMYSKVPTIQFSTEYRTVVFRKYLTIYLKSYKKELSDFVNGGKYKEMDQSELWKTMLDILNNIVRSYEKECDDTGIPKVIVSKMKQKNNDTIQLTIDLIQNISTSAFYQSDDNLLKVYSILNITLSILENTIANSESICNTINGQLKGLSMDGKTEP